MKENIRQGMQLGLYAVILACAACSEHDRDSSPGEATGSGELSQQEQEIDMNTSSSIGERLTQQVSDAVADLSARTGVAADAISVIQARSVQWGSGAVGCPQEGMNYTQAIVPGVLVILGADGTVYRYHGRKEGKLAYCPDERAQEPAYGPGKEFM